MIDDIRTLVICLLFFISFNLHHFPFSLSFLIFHFLLWSFQNLEQPGARIIPFVIVLDLYYTAYFSQLEKRKNCGLTFWLCFRLEKAMENMVLQSNLGGATFGKD